MERLLGACADGSEALLEFAPCLFDRVEVRRVGRQVEQRSPARLDPLAYAVDLVGAEVVHDDDMTWPQLGAQHLIEVGEEDFTVGGRLDGHGGQHAAVVHRTQDGDDLPVTAGNVRVDAPTTRSACRGTRHLGRHAAFIQVDQVLGRDFAELSDERFAPEPIGFGVALGGVDRLFFSRRPNPFTTRAICAKLIG